MTDRVAGVPKAGLRVRSGRATAAAKSDRGMVSPSLDQRTDHERAVGSPGWPSVFGRFGDWRGGCGIAARSSIGLVRFGHRMERLLDEPEGAAGVGVAALIHMGLQVGKQGEQARRLQRGQPAWLAGH